MLDTGFANNNNNDHVLSFDGSQLAISHHDPEDNGDSVIYTLPSEGSSWPRRVTKKGMVASYLHGWSPERPDVCTHKAGSAGSGASLLSLSSGQ